MPCVVCHTCGTAFITDDDGESRCEQCRSEGTGFPKRRFPM
jgi:predicted Zn-ribbon and HTH transcriptional regulator